MKHLKLFKENRSDYPDEEYENFKKNLKVGDIVYCINKGNIIGGSRASKLVIGNKYTIYNIDSFFIYIKEIKGGCFPWRFSKDPNHPKIIEYTANKYNL